MYAPPALVLESFASSDRKAAPFCSTFDDDPFSVGPWRVVPFLGDGIVSTAGLLPFLMLAGELDRLRRAEGGEREDREE